MNSPQMERPRSAGGRDGAGEVDNGQHRDSTNPEQLTLFGPPPLAATVPPPHTLPGRLLSALLASGAINHPEWEALSASWRAGASVRELRKAGWPVETLRVPSPTPERPSRHIARYRLEPAQAEACRELVRAYRRDIVAAMQQRGQP